MSKFSKFFSLVGFKKTKRHRHKKQKRMRNTRRRYMRGGWGGSPAPPTINLMKGGVMKGVMKGGWGPPVVPM
jgi:hypothetical protein